MARSGFLAIGILLSAMAGANGAAATGPSFDCAKAATRVETLICRNQQLIELDANLMQAVRTALAEDPAAHDRILSDERQWLRTRDAACVLVAKSSDEEADACLADEYRKRIAILQTPHKSLLPNGAADTDKAICRKIADRYRALLAQDPHAPFQKGDYAARPLTVLAANAMSGIKIAPASELADFAKDPDVSLQQWGARQKPPISFPKDIGAPVREFANSASTVRIAHLPDTELYRLSSIQGTADCDYSLFFQSKYGRIQSVPGPASWNDADGQGCGVVRDVGKVDGDPAAFEDSYAIGAPDLDAALTVARWSTDRFGPSCKIRFAFQPRFFLQATFNRWKENCAGAGCQAMRQAALGLVETAEKDPLKAQTILTEGLNEAQRADFEAMRKQVPSQQKPGDDTQDAVRDDHPLLLPLVSGNRLYLARVGHFTIGWRVFSDWSVVVERSDAGKLVETGRFAIGMSKGELIAADVQ